MLQVKVGLLINCYLERNFTSNSTSQPPVFFDDDSEHQASIKKPEAGSLNPLPGEKDIDINILLLILCKYHRPLLDEWSPLDVSHQKTDFSGVGVAIVNGVIG